PPWGSSNAAVTVLSRYSPTGTVAGSLSERPKAEPSRPTKVARGSVALLFFAHVLGLLPAQHWGAKWWMLKRIARRRPPGFQVE
ncbi:MAG: hypothetical protein ACXWO1_02350, partial [Isosphaeraceae bacterium]